MSCWNYKKPATTNERRKTQCRGNTLSIDGYDVKIRASRNCTNLPNTWDEVITMGSGRSWKNFRKKKYCKKN